MLRSAWIEALKWRRTWFLLVTIGAVLSTPLLNYFVFSAMEGVEPYSSVLQQNILWYLMMIGPLVVTLIGAQTIAVEYQWDTWKVNRTSPTPRWQIYAAKWLVGVVWILGLTWVAASLSYLSAILLGASQPQPLLHYFKVFTLGGLLLAAMLPVHHLVTLATRSFFVTSGVGIVSAFAGIVLVNSKYQAVFPVSGPAAIVGSVIGLPLEPDIVGTLPVWIGIQVGVAALGFLLSMVYVQRADFR
jgi:lantibiotic transport system permease protein